MRLSISLLLLAACGSTPKPPTDFPPLPGESPAVAAAEVTCMPDGLYRVSVDLSSAKISQLNTGMDGTEWCRSMLQAVPSGMMSTMRISRDDGRLAVAWPHTRVVGIASLGACSFHVTTPPITAQFTFTGGRGSATGDYTLGTVNHPDESCTAEGARFTVEPAPPAEEAAPEVAPISASAD
jgi:hypothetical protein